MPLRVLFWTDVSWDNEGVRFSSVSLQNSHIIRVKEQFDLMLRNGAMTAIDTHNSCRLRRPSDPSAKASQNNTLNEEVRLCEWVKQTLRE